jgi:glycosyltransferase involved in cell wall biosynthesis
MKVTIAVFTFNRAQRLSATLAKLALVQVPEGFEPEFFVVDNGSSDGTREVVDAYSRSSLRARYICEPARGVAYSRNRALACAKGDVIVFLDDDAQPAVTWLESLCAPLFGSADAVAGKVVIPVRLSRPWMTPRHRTYLGSTELLDPHAPQGLISANMAISRSVLEKVPAFDTELGPGRLGFWEDSLFSFQIKQAGYKIRAAFDAVVEHHFDESRLERTSFIDRVSKEGRCRAYVAHHWQHRDLTSVRRRAWLLKLRLLKERVARREECVQQEGIPEWEMQMIERLSYLGQYLKERQRPRAYSLEGLVKIGPGVPTQNAARTRRGGDVNLRHAP